MTCTCKHCHEGIEYIDGVGWVECDEDGHYDICPDNYVDENHYRNAGHELACEGHESLSGPIGNVTYCDGSCRPRR